MNGFDFILIIVGAVISFFILYMIIKAAVRDGIIEARQGSADTGGQDEIAKIVCPDCGKKHEMDYPKCPYCGRVNFE